MKRQAKLPLISQSEITLSEPARRVERVDALPDGIDAQGFAEVVDFWLERRHPQLPRHRRRLQPMEREVILNWLRLYGARPVIKGIAATFNSGKPVRSINFCQPQVQAEAAIYKETAVGGD